MIPPKPPVGDPRELAEKILAYAESLEPHFGTRMAAILNAAADIAVQSDLPPDKILDSFKNLLFHHLMTQLIKIMNQ